jgi:hypothetical protein
MAPSINFTCSIENYISLDISVFDFVIICGIMDIDKISDINRISHKLNIPNCWCFMNDFIFHLLNDFGEFSYGLESEIKTISFPSLEQIFRDISLEKKRNNILLSDFYSVIQGSM